VVELKGSLRSIGLPEIVQLIGELHHTGTLHLSRDHETGQLMFAQGRLVAAECGEIHGLPAITACAVDLGDAEFNFVEGGFTADQTLDVSPAELRRIMGHVTNGYVFDKTNGTATGATTERAEIACPLLGFADNRTRHYARPTALHRCFGTRAPSLVTSVDQREMCLSGNFAACPRYQAAEINQVSATAQVAQRPPAAVPRGVAARISAATQMRATPAARVESTARDEPPSRLPAVLRRGPLLIGAAIVLGLILVALLALLIMPLLNRPAAPATVEATVAVAGAEVTQQPTVAALPTTALLALPTPTTLVKPLVPAAAPTVPAAPTLATTTAPSQQAVASAGIAIMDVRFASVPVANWIDHKPYASWSDGAYRLNAQDATRFVAIGVPVNRTLSDVIISATFRKTGGPPGGGYGVIVRDQGQSPRDGVNQQFSGYVLEAGDKGEYGIWRRDGDHFIDLIPWSDASSVRSGGSPNDLTVKAIGNRLSFAINGTEVATAEDPTFASGGVGIFVGGDYNEVALDHFSVTVPQ
jgi:Domain of unknown function (DUF4388)